MINHKFKSFVLILLIVAAALASRASGAEVPPEMRPAAPEISGPYSGLAGPSVANPDVKRDIEPGLTLNEKIESVIAAIRIQQGGADTVFVNVRGFEMPLPRMASAPGEAKLVLQFDGARFPQTTEKRDWWQEYDWDVLMVGGKYTNTWWKEYDIPLVHRVNAEPVDEGSLRLTFTSAQPLVLEKINGVGGADEITLQLKVFKPERPAAAPPAEVLAQGDPMGINKLVSLTAQGNSIPLYDAFDLLFDQITDKGSLKYFIDPAVSNAEISLKLVGVPFNKVFGILLRSQQLAYRVEGGVIMIGPEATLGNLTGEEVTRAYNLSYAVDKAGTVNGDVTAVLSDLVPLSKPPVLDARNRQLYVTATPKQHEYISEVIEKLDQPGRQIMLEAKIFEVYNNATQDLEALVSAVYDKWIATFTSTGLEVGYTYLNGNLTGEDWPTMDGQGPGNSTYDIVNGYGSGHKALSAGLRALETKGKGKTLASPSIITIDGQQAVADMSQEIHYPSGIDANGNTSYSSVSIGPKLTFTPVVGRDGVVTIDIDVSASTEGERVAMGNGGYTIGTNDRSVKTIVRVRDGEPFVVGGLFNEDRTKTRSRIPVLGYIPLLGDLFTIKGVTHNIREVAIIVIPHILDVPNSEISSFELRQPSLRR
jgi:type IV pilus assembly protein PilQ